MGLPSKLKNMALFANGTSYVGQVTEVTLPKLSRKTEAFRAGGMGGAAQIDMGLDDDALQFDWTIGGYVAEVIKQLNGGTIDGAQVRFTGAYQRDDTGEYDAVEIVVRGRHKELDRGTAKVGDDTTTKVTTNPVYYKESLNGQAITEIDVLGMKHIVNGVDILAEQRRALGI